MKWLAAISMLVALGMPSARADINDDLAACQGFISSRAQPISPAQLYCVGIAYATGRGQPKDVDQANALFRKAADQNDARAQTMLGFSNDRGLGMPVNYSEAMRWYRRASDQGNADAMNYIGIMYRDGRGVQRDDVEATKWFRAAAQRGYRDAQTNLADMARPRRSADAAPGQELFEQGKILYYRSRRAEAAGVFLKAAEQGNAQAQVQIGNQYENGDGVTKNLVQAAVWYGKAAQQGNATAQANLGNMYEHGAGVMENWTEAVKWYRQSAAQGNARGELLLGRMYQFGMGVPQSRAEAIAWFEKAAARGNAPAASFAKSLRNPLASAGFRNEQEEAIVLGGKLPFTQWHDPAGMAFHNAGERLAYLMQIRHRLDTDQAYADWSARRGEFEECRRNQRPDCRAPGPPPS